jgi:hypothetical protein
VKRPPSDYELLRVIYERHHDDFVGPRSAAPTGIMLPIDVPAIATTLGTNDDIVFGRLYYHLAATYGEERREDDSPRKAFFIVSNGLNCVNFPLLEAVLAGLWQERDRQLWAVWASAISISIALAALIVSIVFAVS